MPALWDHEFYIYNADLMLLRGNGHGNVLVRLVEEKTYIVDNNSNPKALADQFPQFHFIIGASLSEEAENLDGVLFSKIPPGGFPNLFVLDVTNNPPPLSIHVHRVSPALRAVFNEIPPLSQDSPENRKSREDKAASFEKQLKPLRNRSLASINSEVDALLPCCRGNWQKSSSAAELLMACYLLSSKPADRERLIRKGYFNLRGDSTILFESLLFGFSIVSEDKDVQWMAKRAGLEATTRNKLTIITGA